MNVIKTSAMKGITHHSTPSEKGRAK